MNTKDVPDVRKVLFAFGMIFSHIAVFMAGGTVFAPLPEQSKGLRAVFAYGCLAGVLFVTRYFMREDRKESK